MPMPSSEPEWIGASRGSGAAEEERLVRPSDCDTALLPWSSPSAAPAPVRRCGHTLLELYRWCEKLCSGLARCAPAASDGRRLFPAEV